MGGGGLTLEAKRVTGLQMGDVTYCVTDVPRRKRKHLVRLQGVVFTPVAQFYHEEEAEEFLEWWMRTADMLPARDPVEEGEAG